MDILYFGNDWFAENRTSSHHIATNLAKLGHRVLYIECPGLRAPKGNKRDITKIFKKLLAGFRHPVRVSDNLYVATLVQIPLHRFAFVRMINRLLTRLAIRLRN